MKLDTQEKINNMTSKKKYTQSSQVALFWEKANTNRDLRNPTCKVV